ncbi:MAG TPA: PilZ domain-containing protein [Caulobacteraceae bacterium]|jgi:PilZ domain
MTSKIGEKALGRRTLDIPPHNEPAFDGPDQRTGMVRRAAPRARSLLTGKIIIGDGRESHECVVRNLSATGAHVRIAGAVNLPGTVGLLVVKEALLFDAAIAWRRGDQIGLTFSAQYDLREDRDPAHRQARALWTALSPH